MLGKNSCGDFFAEHLEAHRCAIVPPIRHEAFLAILQQPFLRALPRVAHLGASVVLRGGKQPVRLVEHLEIKRELPLREQFLVKRIAGRAGRIRHRCCEPCAVVHRVERLALDPLVRRARFSHPEVFIDHPALRRIVALHVVLEDISGEPPDERARLIGRHRRPLLRVRPRRIERILLRGLVGKRHEQTEVREAVGHDDFCFLWCADECLRRFDIVRVFTRKRGRAGQIAQTIRPAPFVSRPNSVTRARSAVLPAWCGSFVLRVHSPF